MAASDRLTRSLGLPEAILLGLGSMVGAGVFVSIGIAAGVAGPAVVLAIALAAGVATCNALSSAQLAAAHPVSGGTYEYGYRYLSPTAGFAAGWLFLIAKSASAATAALGVVGYILSGLGSPTVWLVPGALLVTAMLTALVASGLKRSSWANAVIVGMTLLGLAALVVSGIVRFDAEAAARFVPFFEAPEGGAPATALLHGTALMFVAFTGYGRLATLGEEVRDPKRTIPLAIGWTVAIVSLLYVAVGFVSVGALGAGAFGASARAEAAPLEVVAQALAVPGLRVLIGAAAVTALLGVLLNLLLGLSRVLLAMGRRGDMPRAVTRLNAARSAPTVAVLVVGGIVAALALFGDVRTTWSFSAFTVLLYYAVTNASALRQPPEERRYPRVAAWTGLAACLGLAFFVEPWIWATGLGLLALGMGWFAVARRIASRRDA